MAEQEEGNGIVSPIGRVLWVDHKPDSFGKYTVRVAFDEDADLHVLEEKIEEALLEKFGAKPPKKLNMPVKDGNEETNDDGDVWPSCKDMRIVRFSSKRKPQCVGPKGKDDRIEIEDIYSGCFVRVRCDFFAYKHEKGNKGVSAGLSMIQFARHGDSLGGGSDNFEADEVFDEIPQEEEDTPWK